MGLGPDPRQALQAVLSFGNGRLSGSHPYATATTIVVVGAMAAASLGEYAAWLLVGSEPG
jgi:hypothetical protein